MKRIYFTKKAAIIHLALFVLLGLGAASCFAQEKTVFTYAQFYELLSEHHPVIKQSNLITDDARQELMMAKGGFDPALEGTFDRKVYKTRKYFDRGDGFLKVPIWLGGADLKVGYDRNVGETLSDDIRTGPEGITYVGLTVPLGQGFSIDRRRAILKQARLFQNIADAERVKLVNKLILTAAKDYWNWYLAYQQLQLTSEFYKLADVRYQAVSQRATLGDLAPIDTTEAYVTLLDRQVMLSQAELDFKNASLILSNHLWDDQEQPVELAESVIPQNSVAVLITEAQLFQLRQEAEQRHPELVKLSTKQLQLKVDERLAREMLKPYLNFNASALYQGFSIFGNTNNTGLGNLWNNYKMSLDLYFPIFLRKERGKIQQVRIKQIQTELEQKQVQREILNEVSTAFNEVKTLEQQLITQRRSIQNQDVLLKAELMKFDMGESSLFLVNSRESKLNESKIKLEALKSKYEKAMATLLFAAGRSNWED
jgi:outer membrane protein TolC